MNRYVSKVSPLSGLVIGIAAGMLAMYAMDPGQGKRRRAEVRDKLVSASLKTRRKIDAKSRHFANRAKGLQARAGRLLH